MADQSELNSNTNIQRTPSTPLLSTSVPVATTDVAQNNGASGSAASSESSSSVISATAMADDTLHVEISDALSEKDKVKFTVHTRTSLPGFSKSDNNVVRQHEEFVWLHDRFEENEDYAGYIVSEVDFITDKGGLILDKPQILFIVQIP